MRYLPLCPLFSALDIYPMKKLCPPLCGSKSYQINKPSNRKLKYVIDKDDVTTFAVTESIIHFHCPKLSQKEKGWGEEEKKKTLVESVSIHGPHITSLSTQTGRSWVLKSRLVNFQWTLNKNYHQWSSVLNICRVSIPRCVYSQLSPLYPFPLY